MEDLIRIATLLAPHGVKGEVKAAPDADDPRHLSDLTDGFVGKTAETSRPVRIERLKVSTSRHGHTLFVKLAGTDAPETAQRLRGLGLFARREALPLADDEYFVDDATGFAAIDEAGTRLGTVREIVDLPAGTAFVVARDGLADVIVPDVPAFVVAVDLDGRRLVLRPIPGLFDDGGDEVREG